MMQFDVLGVGTPLLDHMLQVSDAYIKVLPGKKYGMEVVSYSEMVDIIEKSGSVPEQVAGGSCANAIKGLAALGRRCAFIGKVGKDALGEKIVEDLYDRGVAPLLLYSDAPTGHVACLITPDGRRTCRTFVGAGGAMQPEDLEARYFSNIRLVHLEGYTLLCPGLTLRAMQLAKKAGALVSFDLGSFEIVAKNKPLIVSLLSEYADVVFANEDEAHALTGADPENACRQMAQRCQTVIVMTGKKGCWVGRRSAVVHCPAFPVEPVDTTGAGDLFASGFLHGYLSEKPVEECARWGALTARAVVLVVGAEIPESDWEKVKKEMFAAQRPYRKAEIQ